MRVVEGRDLKCNSSLVNKRKSPMPSTGPSMDAEVGI